MSELACLPFGVGHRQEGICLQLKIGPYHVLVDCGLRTLAALEAMAGAGRPADFLFCSHAHPDHARGLLAFHKTFPQVPIYGSEVTAQLLPLNWLDQSPTIPSDICHALPWRTPMEVADGLTLQIWPAGHLPGAACLYLAYQGTDRQYSVLYTGDFFLSNSRLVEGLPLDDLRGIKPDVLILEGTYGTVRHPHRRQQENRLAETIHQLIQENRCILMPTPTLGIGQELVMLLRSHHHFTGKDFTVWVDPVVAAGCDLYLELMPNLPSSVQNFARHQPLFWDERILPKVRRIPPQGKFDPDTPCIVIGHRSADLGLYCAASPHPWTVLLPEDVASQVANTALKPPQEAGDPILDWLQTLSAHLASGQLQIETYLLTSHSDGVGTTQLIHNLRPQHVAFVHGDLNYLADLANLEELQNRYQLHLPSVGKLVEFPLGEHFIQPDAPDLLYDGEVTQAKDGVTILLPETLAADPRWKTFSETGVLQARWQGDNLVLRSIGPQELLQNIRPVPRPGQQTCQDCRFLRQHRCSNPRSPLFELRVTPDGYCPVFEPIPEVESDTDTDEDIDDDPKEALA